MIPTQCIIQQVTMDWLSLYNWAIRWDVQISLHNLIGKHCFSNALSSFFKKKIFIYLFIYFGLHWVFVAAHGLSLVEVSGDYSLLWCVGFSCCGAWALGVRASVAVAHRLSSCGLWALERRLSSCGAWA